MPAGSHRTSVEQRPISLAFCNIDSALAGHAGDEIVELVAWLEKGEISAEEDLLEALAGAPLPRKGASAASKSAPAAGAHRAFQLENHIAVAAPAW